LDVKAANSMDESEWIFAFAYRRKSIS